jgi:hypothetical protein
MYKAQKTPQRNQKSVAFFTVIIWERNQESDPVYDSIKIIKYGINLTKEVKDLYAENFKILMKEVEEDLNKWTNILCS